MAKVVQRTGWGVVEPNHLSAQHTGQIYAQLPCAAAITLLENGQFMKYDYANGECNFTGDGEFMLVMNEIKNYDERYQALKDFAYIADNFTDGTYTYTVDEDGPNERTETITHEGIGPFPGRMYPRLLKTNVGDIFTTNTFYGHNTSNTATTSFTAADVTFTVGDFVKVGTNGFLIKTTASTFDNAVTEVAGQPLFKVVKEYTMPDSQPGIKLQRVA
jgi:hypothetical protein